MDGTQRELPAHDVSETPVEATAKPKKRRARRACSDPEVIRAMEKLAATGQATGSRSLKISARVDPGVLAAAAKRFELPEDQVSEIVNAALAIVAKPDRFKEWLRGKRDPLPDDFELAI